MNTGRKKKKCPLYVRAYKVVVRNPKLSLQARAVLSIIRSYANNDGSNCFPSIETIQKDAGCPRRTLERYIAELRKANLISTAQRITGGKQKSSNLYILYDEEYSRIMAKPPAKPRARNGGRLPPRMADGDPLKIIPITEGMRDFA